MEDSLTMFDNNFDLSDSEMPYFSYPGFCVDYTVTDFSDLSCLFDPQMSYQTEPDIHLDDTTIRGSLGDISSISSISSNKSPDLHDDLSNLFSGHLLSSQAAGQLFTTPNVKNSQLEYSAMLLDNHLASTAPNSSASPPATTHSDCPAIFTSGFEPANHHTVINNGQITPVNSPPDLQPQLCESESTKTTPATLRQSRKGKEVAAITTSSINATAAASAKSVENVKPLKGGKGKVKKRTKSQLPSKKTTIENDATKREAFLKRNKEAAYRCRMKVRMQRVEDAKKMMVLQEDNLSKGLEIEKLRGEICELKRLLLSPCR